MPVTERPRQGFARGCRHSFRHDGAQGFRASRAILGGECAAVDEDLRQRNRSVTRPALEGVEQIGLLDQADLKAENAQ